MNNDDVILENLENLERELEYVTSTPMRRRFFLASLPLILGGCASTSGSRYREGDNRGQETEITVADERQMTAEYLPKMKKEYPPHKNKQVQNFVKGVGNRIVKANNLHNKPYRYSFTAVDSKMVNAFALPAGTVFVTTPLIKLAKSEAELAGVIGHEIGHVKARHTAERIDKAKKEKVKTVLYGLGGALLGGAAGYGLSKLICKPNDRECVARIAKYGALAGGAGGLLIQKFAFMANSREDEMEADRIGFKTSLKGGYHKDHIGLFYSRLLEMEKKAGRKKGNKLLASLADAMSTHPPSKERVGQMNEMARTSSNVGSTVSTKDFKKIQKIIS